MTTEQAAKLQYALKAISELVRTGCEKGLDFDAICKIGYTRTAEGECCRTTPNSTSLITIEVGNFFRREPYEEKEWPPEYFDHELLWADSVPDDPIVSKIEPLKVIIDHPRGGKVFGTTFDHKTIYIEYKQLPVGTHEVHYLDRCPEVGSQILIRRLTPYLVAKQICFVRSKEAERAVAQLQNFPLGLFDELPAIELLIRKLVEKSYESA